MASAQRSGWQARAIASRSSRKTHAQAASSTSSRSRASLSTRVPSLVTLPGVLASTFRAAGRRIQDYLTLTPLDPICRYTFADSTHLDMSLNLPRLVSELDGIAPGEVANLFRFLAYARTLFKRAGPIFLLRERPALRDLLSRRGLDAARIDAHLSMHTAVSRFFRDPRLVQFSTGTPPTMAPRPIAPRLPSP